MVRLIEPMESGVARQQFRDPSIHQKNDASCIPNKRGMARRAKRNSGKRDRQRLAKELPKTHDKDCHLGINWKWCACCVEQWNETCAPHEVMKLPE